MIGLFMREQNKRQLEKKKKDQWLPGVWRDMRKEGMKREILGQ